MAPTHEGPWVAAAEQHFNDLQRTSHVTRAAAGAAATAPSTAMYLGLGIGVGGAILIAIVIVVVKIVKKHREHRSLIEVLEVEEAVQVARAQEIREVPRPASGVRRSTLNPLHVRAGWGALSSNETVDEPSSAKADKRRKRDSVSLPKGKKRKGISLRMKRLTAIMESPRSKAAASPAIAFPDQVQDRAVEQVQPPSQPSKAYTLRKVSDEDVFMCPGSPKPDVLPSFAIRSPGRYGAGIATNNDTTKASRSRSVGALTVTVFAPQDLAQVRMPSRPQMHTRSISLGVPPSRPPSCPVPPLPVIEPLSTTNDSNVRQGFCVTRQSSSSSRDSASSSVLVSSPILTMHNQDQQPASPTVADVIADDDSASLKNVATKQWQAPQNAMALPSVLCRDMSKSKASIRSNMARYSIETLSTSRLSTTSEDSTKTKINRLSIPKIATADQISISRVSSSNSLSSGSGVKKVVTPRKARRTSVSASGSPAERRKTSVLRDISGNSMGPSRQLSNATQDSGRSTNGNPFQWDLPLTKPSALKGSPNARKGHKRQNCVRISTLTPQILGPPPSRPTSPNIMHGIEEEPTDDEESGQLRFVSNHRLSRPPSGASFAPNLRIQTLRASLTPSSPTLSAWNAFQEHGLPSLPSDSQLSASPAKRPGSRQSDCSSAFTIPSFPSPIKATVSDIQLNQPVPQFCLSRPSADIEDDDSSSPFGLQLSSDRDMHSSPPLPASKHVEYDPAHPAWSTVTIPQPSPEEYDPTSPSWDTTEPVCSSPFFPFAAPSIPASAGSEQDVSPRTVLPNSYGGDLPDTPPCSPKTMPEGFQDFFDNRSSGSKPRRSEEEMLTSSNASAIMARMPSVGQTVDFPGAPVLAPPAQAEEYMQTTLQRPQASQTTSGRQRSTSTAQPQYHPLRSAPPPPMPTIPSSDLGNEDLPDVEMPSPLHLGSKSTSKPSPGPVGPRSQPANSVLKNALALRRMNSEVNNPTDWSPAQPHATEGENDAWSYDTNRESKKFLRMGREASPLLPWIGSPELGEGDGAAMDAVFDFGFAAAGAEEDEWEGAGGLDEIDLSEVERRLDGALAGFEAAAGSDDTVLGMPVGQGLGVDHIEERNRICERKEERKTLSVWEDGEKFWERPGQSSPLPTAVVTPRKSAGYEKEVLDRPRSIQMTPKSLYDSDGFLRT
ncbi:uncharacterized protein LTR77_009694 [Saxophila tyrrhenica]|uniref:Uncharacterized protein n=1 Tax=Saxophila tyrrhenica TaxID=1690608 RepID=A0AAV9NXN5_9PEZI|nr:hypothetical protein LTR77_009694 [Saxophila tyrrhenica]